MSDETQATPVSTAMIHPKVAAGAVAGIAVATLMNIAKAHWGIDLSGQEANITILITALAAHYTPEWMA